MFKNLLQKLKSQKVEKITSKQRIVSDETFSEPSKQIKQKANIEVVHLTEINYQALIGQTCIISQKIRTIRYQHFTDQISDHLYNHVLSCPVSQWNYLPFAKRKVKEINFKKDVFPEYLYFLKPLLQRQLPTYNHALINVYPAGVGIMPHFDGPSYKNKVIVLSLGGPAIINFTENYGSKMKNMKLLLEDKSIHIFQHQAYQKYLHGIEYYQYDAIFLRVQLVADQNNQKHIQFSSSSIDNFNFTNFKTILEKQLFRILNQKQVETQYDISEQMNGVFTCLIQIQQNQQYNWKVEIGRRERISITIRQFYT